MILVPVDGWTSHDVLRLRYCGELGWVWLRLHVRGIFARVCAVRVLFATACCVGQTGQCWREDVLVRLGGLRALFLQRAHERLRVGYSGCLEVLEGPQVALALFALQLQERDGGAQGDGIWVLAL